jgi:prolyl-tRNA synthetase
MTFQDEGSNVRHVYATSWGVSTRLIGALIMMHSDDKAWCCRPDGAQQSRVCRLE